MLTIKVKSTELWDESKNEFIIIEEAELNMEHSLLSISKWESKWCKPFLKNDEKTDEEIIDYFRCMTLNENVNPYTYLCLTQKNRQDIIQYINASHTATWFGKSTNNKSGYNRKILTSEYIYYKMIACGIPFECEKWDISRLFTLIRVCYEENKPNRSRSKRDIMMENRRLNRERRKKYNSKG